MPEYHPHTICLAKLNPIQNQTICIVKWICCTVTLLCLAVFILKTLTTEPFAGNEWLAKKVKFRAQNNIQDVSININLNMP